VLALKGKHGGILGTLREICLGMWEGLNSHPWPEAKIWAWNSTAVLF
jgi:hypothetical protein